MVEPCTTSEVSTTTNATWNSSGACGNPAIIGNNASTMGTAPRRPTQAMKAISRRVKRNGFRHNQTATGRASRMSTAAITSPAGTSCHRREGVTSRPSSRNMPACDSHA